MSIVKKKNRYQVYTSVSGRQRYLTSFKDEEKARAFNERMKEVRRVLIQDTINIERKKMKIAKEPIEYEPISGNKSFAILQKVRAWEEKLRWQEEKKGFKEHIIFV